MHCVWEAGREGRGESRAGIARINLLLFHPVSVQIVISVIKQSSQQFNSGRSRRFSTDPKISAPIGTWASRQVADRDSSRVSFRLPCSVAPFHSSYLACFAWWFSAVFREHFGHSNRPPQARTGSMVTEIQCEGVCLGFNVKSSSMHIITESNLPKPS